MNECICQSPHERSRIVLTGGPGGGKTAVLELIRLSFCDHVRVLPEAASIVFGGGFPRAGGDVARRAAQRAIFYLQRELEEAAEGGNPAILLCDRGTVDGVAYWPHPDGLFPAVGTTLEAQLGRYDAVIHLRSPASGAGYNHQNPLRTESAEEAAALDQRIIVAWDRHPRRFIVEPSPDFLDKAATVLEILRAELPLCCRHHYVPALDGRSRSDAGPPVTAR